MTGSRTTVTLRDVAAAAGVSTSLASRVLNADARARISPETASRVRSAATRLKYVPNQRARAFRSSRSGALGLVVPDVNNAVFSELFGGVLDTARREGHTVLLGQAIGPDRDRPSLLDIVGQGRVDGVVLQRDEHVSDATLAAMLDIPQPVVLFNSRLRGRKGSVILPDAAAAEVATRYLLDLGHQRIGHIAGTRTHDAAERRAEGYRSAMRDSGHAVDDDWVVRAGWEAPAGTDALTALLAARRPPTGIVVASVNAALGAASAAARHGIRVPEELSIVTIQDTWVAQVATPALTVVRMPMREAGTTAARMLLRAFDGEEMVDVVASDPEPELVVRASTAPPPLTLRA